LRTTGAELERQAGPWACPAAAAPPLHASALRLPPPPAGSQLGSLSDGSASDGEGDGSDAPELAGWGVSLEAHEASQAAAAGGPELLGQLARELERFRGKVLPGLMPAELQRVRHPEPAAAGDGLDRVCVKWLA
jgi:hypothetical protein